MSKSKFVLAEKLFYFEILCDGLYTCKTYIFVQGCTRGQNSVENNSRGPRNTGKRTTPTCDTGTGTI